MKDKKKMNKPPFSTDSQHKHLKPIIKALLLFLDFRILEIGWWMSVFGFSFQLQGKIFVYSKWCLNMEQLFEDKGKKLPSGRHKHQA